MKWIYLLLAIITEVVATTALKESQGFTKVMPSLIVVIGYSLTFFLLSLTLKHMSVGITYAIWSGMGILLISLIGYFRYNQMLDAPAFLGMIFIALGIIILRFFSNSVDNIFKDPAAWLCNNIPLFIRLKKSNLLIDLFESKVER